MASIPAWLRDLLSWRPSILDLSVVAGVLLALTAMAFGLRRRRDRTGAGMKARPDGAPPPTGSSDQRGQDEEAGAPARAASPRKARVFISYSRRDADFTRRLAQALALRGYLADFDQAATDPTNIETGISADDEWWRRLQEMIATAETMVFVVSPESASSHVCDEEIAYARALGKRVIPLMRHPIDFQKAPPRLAALNVKLSFVDDATFEPALEELTRALDTDVAWHRDGAHYMGLAAKWEGSGRLETQLLSAGAVALADAWAARRPAAAPPPGGLLIEFLDESRHKTRNDRERLLTITGRAFVRPAEQATLDGRFDVALRLAAAGALLGDDLDMRLVPERIRAVLAAGFQGQLRSVFSETDRLLAVDANADRVALGGENGLIRICDALTRRELARLQTPSPNVKTVLFSADGARLLSVGETGAIIWDLEAGGRVSPEIALGEDLEDIALTPDGASLIAISVERARVWSADGREIASLAFGRRTGAVHLSEDRRRMAWALEEGNVALSNLDGDASISLEGHKAPALSLALSPDGALLASVTDENLVRIWDAASGRLVSTLPHGQERPVSKCVFSPNGRSVLLVTGVDCHVWDVAGEARLAELHGHTESVADAAFDRQGARIVTAGHDYTARLWDAADGRQLRALCGHENWLVRASFSQDGRRVVTTTWEHMTRLWDASVTLQLAAFRHDHVVQQVALSPDGQRVAVAAHEPAARVWDIEGARQVGSFPLGGGGVRAVAFCPAGTRLVVAGFDTSVRIFDLTGGHEPGELRGHEGAVSAAAFSPDGTSVLTLCASLAHLWSAQDSTERLVLRGHEDEIGSGAFSPDGLFIVTASADRSARLWDARDGRELFRMQHQGEVLSAVFSPDGARILTMSSDRVAQVWMLDGRSAVRAWRQGDVTSACFSPDGQRVLTGSYDSTASQWRAEDGERVMLPGFHDALRGHKGAVSGAAYSFDGERILTWSEDGSVRLWDAASGRAIAIVCEGCSRLRHAMFTPDGERVVTAEGQGTVRVWDVARTAALCGDVAEALAASLTNGRGVRLRAEETDLLLKSVLDEDKDLCAALTRRLAELDPDAPARVAARDLVLNRPLHHRCYRPAT